MYVDKPCNDLGTTITDVQLFEKVQFFQKSFSDIIDRTSIYLEDFNADSTVSQRLVYLSNNYKKINEKLLECVELLQLLSENGHDNTEFLVFLDKSLLNYSTTLEVINYIIFSGSFDLVSSENFNRKSPIFTSSLLKSIGSVNKSIKNFFTLKQQAKLLEIKNKKI